MSKNGREVIAAQSVAGLDSIMVKWQWHQADPCQPRRTFVEHERLELCDVLTARREERGPRTTAQRTARFLELSRNIS